MQSISSASGVSHREAARSQSLARDRLWATLPALALPSAAPLRDRLPSGVAPGSVAAQQFDILRTKMLGVTQERGWSRIGVTQPRSKPAAGYAAANLALSLARMTSQRVLLVDLDLKTPSLAHIFGLSRAPDLGKALRNGADLMHAVGRVGDNLAVVSNAAHHTTPAETLQDRTAMAALDQMIQKLAPDVVLMLLAPVLEGDAGLSGVALVDTVLMVSDGTSTVPADLHECDQMIESGPPILGVVLVDAEA